MTKVWIFINRETGEEICVEASTQTKAIKDLAEAGINYPKDVYFSHSYEDSASPNFEAYLG